MAQYAQVQAVRWKTWAEQVPFILSILPLQLISSITHTHTHSGNFIHQDPPVQLIFLILYTIESLAVENPLVYGYYKGLIAFTVIIDKMLDFCSSTHWFDKFFKKNNRLVELDYFANCNEIYKLTGFSYYLLIKYTQKYFMFNNKHKSLQIIHN